MSELIELIVYYCPFQVLEKILLKDLVNQRRSSLYYLKIMQQAGLEELASVMKVSRMAVHKHFALLQQRGLVKAQRLEDVLVGQG